MPLARRLGRPIAGPPIPGLVSRAPLFQASMKIVAGFSRCSFSAWISAAAS
jgi:hypothetical protein